MRVESRVSLGVNHHPTAFFFFSPSHLPCEKDMGMGPRQCLWSPTIRYLSRALLWEQETLINHSFQVVVQLSSGLATFPGGWECQLIAPSSV